MTAILKSVNKDCFAIRFKLVNFDYFRMYTFSRDFFTSRLEDPLKKFRFVEVMFMLPNSKYE
jgi:hypothetical protein